MAEKVVIIGASGHGKVVADIVRAAGDTVVGFLDDNGEKTACAGLPVLGPVSAANDLTDCRFLVAIGDNTVRRRIVESLSVRWYTAVHPAAVVSPGAVLGEGTAVMANAVINAEARVGCHCIINTGAIVEHENVIGDFADLSPAAALGGNVVVGEQTHVGIGACVRNNVTICGGCVIGAGAAVVKDIEVAGTYVGVPARKLT